jgi:hypothetical protein
MEDPPKVMGRRFEQCSGLSGIDYLFLLLPNGVNVV